MSDLTIDSIILTAAAIPATLFVIGYWLFAPWYRSEAGRASWMSMFALAALLDVALVAYWFGWIVPEWGARIIYILIVVGAWLKLGALLHEQIISRDFRLGVFMSNRVIRARRLLDALMGWVHKHPKSDRAERIRKAQKALTPPKPPKKPQPQGARDLPASFPALVKVRAQSKHGPQFGLGECRYRCRLAYGQPSVGDWDGDGSADAEDAWKAAKRKHPGDRKPPRGYPVYWLGGSNDNGHEAISAGVPGSRLGNVLRRLFGRANETWVWSTDIRRAGFFDMVPLSYIEEKWGLTFAGWAEDDNGVPIK